jgi:hypothetical protein
MDYLLLVHHTRKMKDPYFIVTATNANAAVRGSKMDGFCVCTMLVTGKHPPIIQTG